MESDGVRAGFLSINPESPWVVAAVILGTLALIAAAFFFGSLALVVLAPVMAVVTVLDVREAVY